MGVGIALGTRSLGECPAFDVNGNSVVVITELLMAVNAALQDCPLAATPTVSATASASPTVTPTPEPVRKWTVAFDASNVGWMMSGWGPGDGTLWVVGGTEAVGRIFHLSAGEWSEVDPGVAVPLLNWVHGTSATDVFVGSNDGTILHFDGIGWTRQATPVSVSIWGVFAVAPTNVWAVGGNVSSSDPPFILHYDGAAWSRVPLPTLIRPRVAAFFKVWASGPDDVYAVGQNGVVVHYDGRGFTELFLGISQDLIGIWGTGPENVMVVGGRVTAELAHFDGASWQRASLFLPGLNGVWMRRADVAHAVGIGGTVLRVDPRTLEATWDTTVPTRLDLHSVYADAGGQMIVLGANFFTPEHGVALTRRLSNGE
jgi:hypothetical protein